MQTVRLLQAAALMFIVALAASCTATQQYTSKLFAPRTLMAKDSQATALRFLTLDSNETEQQGWVSTDIIMGRDTSNNTTALDNFTKIFPPAGISKVVVKDSSGSGNSVSAAAATPTKAPAVTEEKAVAKNISSGVPRQKRSREE